MVIVILGVLAAIGTPYLRDLVRSQRIKTAASDLYIALSYARSEAVKLNLPVVVAPASGNWANGWAITYTDGGTTRTLQGQDALADLTVECPASTTCATTLTFTRDGRVTSSSGSYVLEIDVTNPDTPRRISRRCLVLAPTGRVNVQTDKNLDGVCANG